MKIQHKIIQEIAPYLIGIYAISFIGFILANQVSAIYSMILGGIFSVFGLIRLAKDQSNILLNRNRNAVLISFFMRLAIIAIPITISLNKTSYFKFWIVLIFLFSSQLTFIIRELITNYIHYKKRMQ